MKTILLIFGYALLRWVPISCHHHHHPVLTQSTRLTLNFVRFFYFFQQSIKQLQKQQFLILKQHTTDEVRSSLRLVHLCPFFNSFLPFPTYPKTIIQQLHKSLHLKGKSSFQNLQRERSWKPNKLLHQSAHFIRRMLPQSIHMPSNISFLNNNLNFIQAIYRRKWTLLKRKQSLSFSTIHNYCKFYLESMKRDIHICQALQILHNSIFTLNKSITLNRQNRHSNHTQLAKF